MKMHTTFAARTAVAVAAIAASVRAAPTTTVPVETYAGAASADVFPPKSSEY